MRTNVEGTYVPLQEARAYHAALNGSEQGTFRFLHVSTDEVYGSLGPDDPALSRFCAQRRKAPSLAEAEAFDRNKRQGHTA